MPSRIRFIDTHPTKCLGCFLKPRWYMYSKENLHICIHVSNLQNEQMP
jgi:hypothetical protein